MKACHTCGYYYQGRCSLHNISTSPGGRCRRWSGRKTIIPLPPPTNREKICKNCAHWKQGKCKNWRSSFCGEKTTENSSCVSFEKKRKPPKSPKTPKPPKVSNPTKPTTPTEITKNPTTTINQNPVLDPIAVRSIEREAQCSRCWFYTKNICQNTNGPKYNQKLYGTSVCEQFIDVLHVKK